MIIIAVVVVIVDILMVKQYWQCLYCSGSDCHNDSNDDDNNDNIDNNNDNIDNNNDNNK